MKNKNFITKMKKITCLLLLIQSGFMMAQTKTVVTQNGEKVTIHPNANNGIKANAGYIQLGGDLNQATTLKTTSAYTLALEGLLAGANSDAVLVIDSNNIIRYVSRTEFAGDNLGNHTAAKDLNMNSFNVNAAANITASGTVTGANITATTKTTTPAAQITTGAGDGKIAVSDATGNVIWKDPATITVNGDNLGNHTATQDLNMNTKNITGAANITATGKTSTATAQITTGAALGYIATSVDAAGNVVWKDPATIATKGDNLGNHTAAQDLNMNAFNVNAATNITATGKTSTATAQITTGAGAGKVAVSDATGNLTWTDPSTFATQLTIDEFPTTPAGETTFTLSATPQALKVQMYVNGVAISKNAISVANNIVTYIPASNGSYALMANDLIKFIYLK